MAHLSLVWTPWETRESPLPSGEGAFTGWVCRSEAGGTACAVGCAGRRGPR